MGALLAENTQVSEQDVTFGTANLDAYMYTSAKARARVAGLIQDSAFDINTWLPKRVSASAASSTSTSPPEPASTSRTASWRPRRSESPEPARSRPPEVSPDNIVTDIIEALDPAYSQGDGQKFMFHQSVRKALRAKAQGRPEPATLGPSLQAGVADQVAGYGYVINNDMPTLAAGSKSLLFGNIEQAYVVRLVTEPADDAAHRALRRLPAGRLPLVPASGRDHAGLRRGPCVPDHGHGLIRRRIQMPEKKIDETVNPKAAEGTQDRVAMLSLKSDGTPDQTNPVVIGDKEAAVAAAKRQFAEQAVLRG